MAEAEADTVVEVEVEDVEVLINPRIRIQVQEFGRNESHYPTISTTSDQPSKLVTSQSSRHI